MWNEAVMGFMITRAEDPKRLEMFEKTVRDALETAGRAFYLVLCPLTEASKEVAKKLKEEFESIGIFENKWKDNVGQHVITNAMIALADDDGYDYLLRLDDDVKFLTKRWLVKMVEAAEALGPNFIISPMVVGLQNPPDTTPEIEQSGVKFRVILGAIGGICRLHNVETLVNPVFPYVSDVRLPLGFGDATGIAEWCGTASQQHHLQLWMVYLTQVRVKHAKGTIKQVKENPEYHETHDLFQNIPFIPMWEG